MSTVYLGLGSNLGDRQNALNRAYQAIEALPQVSNVQMSPVYETDPIGPSGQYQYLNAAVKLETNQDMIALRQELAAIETALGRPAKESRIHWGPRIIDIDILLCDNKIINHPELTVPHPQMAKRWFVLKPLSEIASDVVHPISGKTIAQMLHELETCT